MKLQFSFFYNNVYGFTGIYCPGWWNILRVGKFKEKKVLFFLGGGRGEGGSVRVEENWNENQCQPAQPHLRLHAWVQIPEYQRSQLSYFFLYFFVFFIYNQSLLSKSSISGLSCFKNIYVHIMYIYINKQLHYQSIVLPPGLLPPATYVLVGNTYFSIICILFLCKLIIYCNYSSLVATLVIILTVVVFMKCAVK